MPSPQAPTDTGAVRPAFQAAGLGLAAVFAAAGATAAEFRNQGMAGYEHGIVWSDGIKWGLVLLVVLVVVALIINAQARNRRRVAQHQQKHANALKYMADHGVGEAEVAAASRYFFNHLDVDPESAVMSAQQFGKTLGPHLSGVFGPALTDVIHDLLFSRNVLIAAPQGASEAVRKPLPGRHPTGAVTSAGGQPPAPPSQKKGDSQRGQALSFVHPGNTIRVVREGERPSFNAAILSTGQDNLVVALPEGTRVQTGEEVEVHIDVGLALCGLVAHVTDVAYARPPACQIGRFVEGWVIRRRQSIRLLLTRALTFSCLPKDQTGKMESLHEITERLAPAHQGELRDVSYGGCCIVTQEEKTFQRGDLIRFSVDLVADCPPAVLFGTVVHIALRREQDGPTNTFLHVQFLALDIASHEILTRALRQLISTVGFPARD